MSTKRTFKMIYRDFRKKHPNLAKSVLYWHPYDLDEIALYLQDRSIMIYNDYTKRGRIDGSWGSTNE